MFKKIETYKNLETDDNEKHRLKLENEVTLFDSRFSFLDDHCGLRPKKVHLFLGTTGTGKSTLIRSIEIDAAKQAPIGIYSSEETIDDTKYMLSKGSISNNILKNMYYLDEEEILNYVKSKDLNGFFTYLYNWLKAIKAKAFFFDNLTSSFYEGQKFETQIEFFNTLKRMGKNLNIPIGLVAHTMSGIKDSQAELIMPGDIRGPKHPSNISEYLYIYQRFKVALDYGGERLTAILRVVKARAHDNASEVYVLGFDAKKREYISDKKIKFSEFNNIFMKRLRLGKK